MWDLQTLKIWFNHSDYLFLIFWPIRSLLTLIYWNPTSKCTFLRSIFSLQDGACYFSSVCSSVQTHGCYYNSLCCFWSPALESVLQLFDGVLFPYMAVSCMSIHVCVLWASIVLPPPLPLLCIPKGHWAHPRHSFNTEWPTPSVHVAVKRSAVWEGNVWSYSFHLLVRCY